MAWPPFVGDIRTRIDDSPSPVVSIVREVAQEFRRDRVTGLSAEIAFFAILSLFPALLALVAALGSMEAVVGQGLAADAQDEVVGLMERVLTNEASGTVDAVQRLFEQSSPGLLTVGLAVALWSASRGFTAVINALDIAYDLEERRSYARLRLAAVGLAIGSVVVGAVLLAVMILGPLLGTGPDVADAIGAGGAFATAWDWVRWPVAAAVAIVWATTILHLAPNHRTRWREDLPGALLAASTWLGLSAGLRAYLAVAGDTNQVFGTLGGALIVLLWLYLLALGLLLGGELNAVLLRRRDQHKALAPELFSTRLAGAVRDRRARRSDQQA
jgi:membrane protein